MVSEPAEEWRDPSPTNSDEGSSSDEGGSSSSDESDKSYEEVLTPRPEKKGKMEEELDPTYTLEKTRPST
jgi:hypothetical protein